MKTYMHLNGLRWSRNSGSANCDMPQSAVFGRPGGVIGDNCIIGAGSLVNKPIPSNSVAAGVPCRVICTIEEYYKKRQEQWVDEAIVYVNAIREREHREPTISDFRPEFGLFIDKHNIENYDLAPIKSRLNNKFEYWLEHHKAPFDGFEDFLEKSKSKK